MVDNIIKMQDFFSNFCVYDLTNNSTHLTQTREEALAKSNDIINESCDKNIKRNVTIVNVCKFMTNEQKQKVCREKGFKFFKFIYYNK
jgi:hypothetical protein